MRIAPDVSIESFSLTRLQFRNPKSAISQFAIRNFLWYSRVDSNHYHERFELSMSARLHHASIFVVTRGDAESLGSRLRQDHPVAIEWQVKLGWLNPNFPIRNPQFYWYRDDSNPHCRSKTRLLPLATGNIFVLLPLPAQLIGVAVGYGNWQSEMAITARTKILLSHLLSLVNPAGFEPAI